MQLYVPPAKMINKDFIKQVLQEEKALMALDKVKFVSVPHYDELSVKKFHPMLMEDDDFRKYMPEPTKDERLPDRTFFWNIAHTLHGKYVKNVITHANDLRMKAGEDKDTRENIVISEAWWEKLNAVPFVSCKLTLLPNLMLTKSKLTKYVLAKSDACEI